MGPCLVYGTEMNTVIWRSYMAWKNATAAGFRQPNMAPDISTELYISEACLTSCVKCNDNENHAHLSCQERKIMKLTLKQSYPIAHLRNRSCDILMDKIPWDKNCRALKGG